MSALPLVDETRPLRQLPAPRLCRLIRESAGVTQVRLAREVGCDRMTIARWEAGTRRPRGELGLRYAEVLAALREAVQ
ncbi:MAG: helix-turn-helix transcriptional regulator [Candidatus Dormibacteria bacterium]